MQRLEKVNRMGTWAAINPVIHSLRELRNNTWDKDRVDGAIEWLERNFEGRKMIVKAVNGKFVAWKGWNSTPLSNEFDTIKEAEEEMKKIEKEIDN